MTARIFAVALLGLVGCKQEEPEETDDDGPACSLDDQAGCPEPLVCEPVVGGEPICASPVSIEGRVFDTESDAGIEGARVVARDANGAATSRVAISAADGTYSLVVTAPRTADGAVVPDTQYTLRADAQSYVPFPTPPRSALPIDLSAATGDPLVVQSTATDVGLIPRSDTAGLGAISGTVEAAAPGGTLVVAGPSTGVADLDGAFAVFDIPAGTVQVHGYKAGLQLAPATADVSADATTEGVVLSALGTATATVSGTVQIVNAPGGASTSVILVVEDAFDPIALSGETPPGLRVGDVDGAWSISGVPDGTYVVLAAFENDDLVRDPDTSIGGTDIVTLTVSGSDEEVAGFKVTEALEVLGPGAELPEVVTAPVTLSWEDDSSEDLYEVEVFDALGELVWETSGDLDPGGNAPVTVPYDGPLDPGMYYQFRVTSLKSGVPLSRTEDLRGVFTTE